MRGPDGPRVGDEVVVTVSDQEVVGKVTRVTPRGYEVSFQVRLPPGILGDGLGHLMWPNGREMLFPLADVAVLGQASVMIDLESAARDQRAFVRLDKRLAVDVYLAGEGAQTLLATGSTADLSTEGARLVLNRGLKRGETVNLALHLDEGPISVPAEVLRHRKAQEGGHEVAVRFRLPPGEGRSRLVRFVFARMRQGKAPGHSPGHPPGQAPG